MMRSAMVSCGTKGTGRMPAVPPTAQPEGALDPLEGLAGLGNERLHEVLVAVAVGHGEPALLHELDGVVLGDGVGAVVEGELVVAHGLEGTSEKNAACRR